MSIRNANPSTTIRVWAGVVLLWTASGCQWSALPKGLEHWPLPASPASASPGPQDAAKSAAPVDENALRDDRAVLATPHWVRTVSPPGSNAPPRFRWRHAGLDDLLARPVDQRPDWHAYLTDQDAMVSTNAAMALARLGLPDGRQRLVDAIRSPQRPMPVRSAAAEALAEIRQPGTVDALRQLLDQYGQPVGETASAYNADLHEELLRGLARHVDPPDDPRFTSALRSPSSKVRLEAVSLWAASRSKELAEAVADLRSDGDARVRAAVLRAFSQRKDARVEPWLVAGVNDTDMQVRLAAVAGLGRLACDDAIARLDKLLGDSNEAIRAAAVAALADAGQRAKVLRAASDPSAVIRGAAADALARWPDREAANLATTLLDDPSPEVQQRLFTALGQWPLEQSGPVLIAGMERPVHQTRWRAAAQLASRWPPAAEFSVDAPPPRRSEILEGLRARFRREIGFATNSDVAQAVANATQAAADRSQTVARVESALGVLNEPGSTRPDRDAAMAKLNETGPELLPVLDHLVLERKRTLPAEVYGDVLPRRYPVFATVEQLRSGDVAQRRRAAESLAPLAAKQPLPRLAVMRLSTAMANESDQHVWRNVMAALANDPAPETVQLAYLAIVHPSPEVRRRACVCLAAHPDPRHAKVLVPLLDDPQPNVVGAAVQALGSLGRLDDPEPLRRLVLHGSESLRADAAIALARVGDPQGRAALARLAYHADANLRRQAAVAMGEAGDPASIATLVYLLDDRPAVRLAAIESLKKLAGRDVAAADGPQTPGVNEQVNRWKQWFAEQHARPIEVGRRP